MGFIKDKLGIGKDTWDLIGLASTMGLHLVSGVLVGLAIGWFLDDWLGTKPWFLLTFLVIGIAAGFKNVYEDARKMNRKSKAEQNGEHDDSAQ